MAVVLRTEALTKRYGGLAAVDDLTFEVQQGRVLGIAGPNGAGKTTLFDVISGHARASGGVVRFGADEIQTLPAHEIRRRGIARTYQVAPVFRSQTVLGHILLAREFGRPDSRQVSLRVAEDSVERAVRAADFVGLADKLGQRGELLSAFDRKRLMIAAAIVTDPSVLMLDEPVAGLTDEESGFIVGLVERLKATGVTILLVEHVMRVLMSVSQRVLIMHQGRSLFEGTPEDVQAHPEVIRVYLGTTASSESAEQRGPHA